MLGVHFLCPVWATWAGQGDQIHMSHMGSYPAEYKSTIFLWPGQGDKIFMSHMAEYKSTCRSRVSTLSFIHGQVKARQIHMSHMAENKGQFLEKKCCSFGFCPNYPPPQFGQLVQLFSDVKIQDLKV